MITDFDRAFLRKIKKVYSNTQYADAALVYNTAYRLIDLEDNAVLKFPLINIFRPSGFERKPEQNFAARKRGEPLYVDKTTNEVIYVRYMRARLPYQLDIYAETHEQVNELTEQIMKYLDLDSTLEVTQYDYSYWVVTKYNKVNSEWVKDDTYVEDLFRDKTQAETFITNLKPFPNNVKYELSPLPITEEYEITYDNGPSEQSEFTTGMRVYHLAIVYSLYNAKLLDSKPTNLIVDTEINLKAEDTYIQQDFEEEEDI